MARELFAAGFVSCWAELEEPMKEALVRSLEAALASPSIPPEIVTTLLNLAEFMEHNEKKLPLDTRQVCLRCAVASGSSSYVRLMEHNEKRLNLGHQASCLRCAVASGCSTLCQTHGV